MKPQTVAIVDDQTTNLKILGRLAASLGEAVLVRTFDRPRDALDAFPADPPDLIITDYIMPDLDGAAFIRSVRAMACCDDVPVIVITAYEDRALRYTALGAGATDFLLSPVDPSEFTARSRNLLTLRRQQLMLKRRASRLERRMAVEEQRHRKALTRSHERLARVIDAIPVMISATDREGRFVFANRHFADSLGQEARDLIGRTPAEVCGEPHGQAWLDMDRRLVEHGAPSADIEEVVTSPDGGERVLQTSKSILREDQGPAVLVVSVSFDITARKQAEIGLMEAMRLAEGANQAKTEFLANMSHELRTPLNAIIGFSEVIAKEMLGPTGTPRYVEYASDINRSAEDLLGTIDDVLDVAKIEAGRLELEEGLVDVGSALREVVGRMRDDARGAGIEIVPSVADGLPHLYGDGPKVRQVLFNLLNNAVTFSPAGSRVDVAAGRDGEAITLSVVDRGIGMDEAEIAIAVSRFGQVASPWTRQHSGTGLGLPLSIGLVELHGGTLHIDSRKGFGTTVTVRFPPERSVSGAQLDGADLSRP